MSKVFWDSMLFIYWIEKHPVHAKRVQYLRERMNARGDRLFTSTLAAAETMVGPLKTGDSVAAQKIQAYFASSEVTTLPFDGYAAVNYASIRARQLFKPPDAIHLACAAAEGMDIFITNDKDLIGKTVPGIQFVVGLDTNLY